MIFRNPLHQKIWLTLGCFIIGSICSCLWGKDSPVHPTPKKPLQKQLQNPDFWNQAAKEKTLRPYPIIFVHGIASGFEKWRPTAQRIGGNSYYEMRFYDGEIPFHTYYGQTGVLSVWNVSYYSTDMLNESLFGDLTRYAKRLEDMVDRILELTGQPKVILIAHSMGGLVSRRYMSMSNSNWNKVDTLLTVGSPLMGVLASPGVIGQFTDLQQNSALIQETEKDWAQHNSKAPTRWGVIGGIMRAIPTRRIDANTTDWGGPTFSAIGSAIPYGEWQAAVETLGIPTTNTTHFGYRIAVEAQHEELLTDPHTLDAIYWAVAKD